LGFARSALPVAIIVENPSSHRFGFAWASVAHWWIRISSGNIWACAMICGLSKYKANREEIYDEENFRTLAWTKINCAEGNDFNRKKNNSRGKIKMHTGSS